MKSGTAGAGSGRTGLFSHKALIVSTKPDGMQDMIISTLTLIS
jgi:hypothetical protein